MASSSVIKEYNNYDCQFLPNLDLPWELYGVNCDMNNGLWVSDNSSALFSYDFTFMTNNRNVFLYGYRLCHNGLDNNEKIIDSFLSRYSEYNQNIFIPNKKGYIKIIKEYCNNRKTLKIHKSFCSRPLPCDLILFVQRLYIAKSAFCLILI